MRRGALTIFLSLSGLVVVIVVVFNIRLTSERILPWAAPASIFSGHAFSETASSPVGPNRDDSVHSHTTQTADKGREKNDVQQKSKATQAAEKNKTVSKKTDDKHHPLNKAVQKAYRKGVIAQSNQTVGTKQSHSRNITNNDVNGKKLNAYTSKRNTVKHRKNDTVLGRVEKSKKQPKDERKRLKDKYLIYLCDKGRSCGGWGDRQRGLINTYLLAYVTGRRFGVNMTVPCNVTHYYLPNDVNWVVREDEIKGRPRRVIHGVGNISFHDSLLTIDFNKVYPDDVVFLRTNIEHYWNIRSNPHYKNTLPIWAVRGRPRFFKDVWNMLMKPAPHLQDLLRGFLQQSHFYNRTKPFVCAHVRIGASRFNPGDSEKRNDVSKLGALWDFLGSYVKNGSQLFLATDNPEVREMSRHKFGPSHHDTGGVILHVDKQRNVRNACYGLEFALLDQLVLTTCDVLVTTQSMFGWAAVLIRGKLDLFHFQKGVVSPANLMR